MTGDRHESKEKRSKKREVTALHDRTGGVWQRVIDARFCLFCFATRTWVVDEWAMIDDVNTLQCSILSFERDVIVERCGILNRNLIVLAALKCDEREPSATKTNCKKFPMQTRNFRENIRNARRRFIATLWRHNPQNPTRQARRHLQAERWRKTPSLLLSKQNVAMLRNN